MPDFSTSPRTAARRVLVPVLVIVFTAKIVTLGTLRIVLSEANAIVPEVPVGEPGSSILFPVHTRYSQTRGIGRRVWT